MSDSAFGFCSRNGYDHGFFSCLADPCVSIITYFVPCIMVGKMTGEMDGKSFNCVSCLCTPIGAYRNRRRIQSMLQKQESDDASVLAVSICGCCAVSQDCHEWKLHKNTMQTVPPAYAQSPTKTGTPTSQRS